MKKDRWPNCIRYNDTVKVLTPTFVTRVGYPKIADDFMAEAEKTLIEKGLLKYHSGTSYRSLIAYEHVERPRAERDFIRKYALLLLRKAGWGGRDRTLHTYEAPEFLGKELRVVGKKVVKTGIHVGPSTHVSNGWDGVDYDYDPGGLGDEKTHILLWVNEPGHFYRGIDEVFPKWPWRKDDFLVIPAANVVKLPNERATD